jgi:hypothetical protein
MKTTYEKLISIVLTLFMFLFVLWLSFFMEPMAEGQPYNSTAVVNTTVNITNSAPDVANINAPGSINLLAYGNTTVICNVTVFDYDNNTAGANATFYLSTMSSLATPDQNYLYTNTSCTRISPLDRYTNYSCGFIVRYFANNGTWYCNATARDSLGASNNNRSNAATINPLIALKMPLLLDYGNVGVNQDSNDALANITNAGNRNANISVKGYGTTEGDGLAMVCSSGSISIEYEAYDIYAGSSFGFMYPLTINSAMIGSFYVPQRTSETTDSSNLTYWKVHIPPGAGGVCNGKILFSASDRGI